MVVPIFEPRALAVSTTGVSLAVAYQLSLPNPLIGLIGFTRQRHCNHSLPVIIILTLCSLSTHF